MKKLTIFFILLISLIYSCKKKDLPAQESQDPVFFIDCEIDGVAQRIEAGNENYFMNTSWNIDSNSFYTICGNLSQLPSGNPNNIEISVLLNYPLPLNKTVSVDSVLQLGPHKLNDEIIYGSKQLIGFAPDKNFEPSASYNWHLTDGVSDIRTVSNYSVSENLPIGKTYSVSLSYNDGLGGCVSSHTNVFRVGNPLQTKIVATRDTTTPELKYNFSYPLPYSGSKFSCAWKFYEDGSSSSMKKPSKLFNPGTSLISLTLIDINTNDTCVSYYQLNATDNQVCDANFNASFEPVVNSSLFATATIKLKDTDGTVYSSRPANQSGSNFFEIVSVSDYKVNANGEPTKIVTMRFNCVLQNGQKQKTITNATAVFAVAYKQ